MIANWMERCLILCPENDLDEQALRALKQSCPPMVWVPEGAWQAQREAVGSGHAKAQEHSCSARS